MTLDNVLVKEDQYMFVCIRWEDYDYDYYYDFHSGASLAGF